MKLHRFYVDDNIDLKRDLWIHHEDLLSQWNRVLRFKEGQKVILFDGIRNERMYVITEITDKEAHLILVTDLDRKLPKRDIYLFWSLLKRDKNDFVLQKCTELGVSNFVPMITERSDRNEVSDNRLHRWNKIVIEAAEQCGRSDIPVVRSPIKLQTVLSEYRGKLDFYVCDQDTQSSSSLDSDNIGLFIGPEGGWSDSEKEMFEGLSLNTILLSDHTLRAETACIVATSKLLQ